MRGLTIFISDLRNARSKEHEDKRVFKEMAHIRNTFKEAKKLDGYNRKKYVAKLLYMHLLGYEVDFGHMEALRLLSSTDYHEKQIGYMALGILLHESHDMIPLIVNSCKVDLESRDSMHQALALSAIANLGGKEMADALAGTVLKLLTTSTTKAFVLKRAALCLLRLFRTYPEIVVHSELKPIIVKLLGVSDVGVQTSAANLLLGVAKDNQDDYADLRQPVAEALHRLVVKKEYKKQYLFYGVPSPWLQVSLIRFQRHYAAPGPKAAQTLDQAIAAVFQIASQEAPASKGVNYRNARQSVLQEAIALVVQQRRRPEMVRQSVALLGRFLGAKTANVRYLALDSMVGVATVGAERAALRRHVDTVIEMLKDDDISIRRRALDVLYYMCDESLAKKIVTELLRYLITADYEIREDLVVKIAILAERYATVYSWYVDVILQLISIAGDYVSDSIWHRVVQIVTNHEDIQEYAVAMAFEALHHPSCHETTVRVGAYLLGEFGHLIAETEGCEPEEQLALLEEKFATVDNDTRAMLLTAYVKMANLYAELHDPVCKLLEQFTTDMSPELQKRAVEYLALLNAGDDDLLGDVLDVMPAFPERESNVVEAAERKKRDAAAGPRAKADDDDDEDAFDEEIAAESDDEEAFDANAESDDESDTPEEVREARERERAAAKKDKKKKKSRRQSEAADAPAVSPAAQAPANGGGGLIDLMGLDFGGGAQAAPAPSAPAAGSGTLADLFASEPTPSAGAASVAAGVSPATVPASAAGAVRDSGPVAVALRALTAKNDGVIFEDAHVQIGLKSSFDNGTGTLTWYHGNKGDAPLSGYAFALVENGDVALPADAAAAPASLAPKSQQQQAWKGVTALRPFTAAPLLAVRYGGESFALRSPLVPTKFCVPLAVAQGPFFAEWKKYEGALAFMEVLQAGRPVSRDFGALLLQAARLAECAGVDPNAENLVGAGQFVAASGRAAVLVRIELNAAAKAYRLSVRTPSAELTQGVAAMLKAHLTA